VEPSALAAWTPVAIDLAPPTPSVDWGDLRGIRFSEPFFQQTVERWAGGDPQPLVRTGLDALAALDDAPSLDPAAFIFHVSRCGSTLLSRALSTVPGTLVISEPAPVNALLMAELDESALVPLLRATIRALGRRRFGDERCSILKLSSWNVRRIALVRRAFPGVPVLWVQRAPLEVMASLLADPPGWAKLRHHPAQAQTMLGLARDDNATRDDTSFCLRVLGAMLDSVRADEGKLLAIDYRDLPQAIWEVAAPFIGLDLGAADIARMREEARFDSKSAERRPFIARDAAAATVKESLRARVAEGLEPLYREIARRHVWTMQRPANPTAPEFPRSAA
jgi:hypothetical protein